MAKLTAIIPVFNEAPRLEAVIRLALDHPKIDELIIVDDGSTDGSADIARAFEGARLIEQPVNGGKTRAMATGIAAARHDLLLFIDADLSGLNHDALTRLIEPVMSESAGISISLRGNAPRIWHWIGVDYISGERVLPKSLIAPHLKALDGLPRFGFEVFLNRILVEAQIPVAIVPWPEISSPLKSKKHGVWHGIRADIAMIGDLVGTVGLFGLIQQIRKIRGLRIKA